MYILLIKDSEPAAGLCLDRSGSNRFGGHSPIGK